MKIRTFAQYSLLVAALNPMLATARAEPVTKGPDGYPDRTVTVIVPFGAGGGGDLVARAWGAQMSELSGVPFQIVNKPGGGGLAAIPDFMSRPSDGYTLLEHDDAIPASDAAGELGIEIGKDISPICITQAAFSQIYIRPDEDRFKDWESFVEYAKANEGQLTVAHSDVETGMEAVQLRSILEAAAFKTKEIRYDKGAERFGALMGGHVDALFEQPGDVIEFVNAGKMKPILTILPARPDAFSDTPALADVGLSDVPVFKRVRMFWVHGTAPEDRKAYLRKLCETAFNSQEFQDFNKRQFMHLDRSYYDSDEALVLIKAMAQNYREHFEKSDAKP